MAGASHTTVTTVITADQSQGGTAVGASDAAVIRCLLLPNVSENTVNVVEPRLAACFAIPRNHLAVPRHLSVCLARGWSIRACLSLEIALVEALVMFGFW